MPRTTPESKAIIRLLMLVTSSGSSTPSKLTNRLRRRALTMSRIRSSTTCTQTGQSCSMNVGTRGSAFYRRELLEHLAASHFYFEYPLRNGLRHVYDSSALVQEELKANGYQLCSLPSKYRCSYLHGGAGSKLKNLTPSAARRYRRVMMLWEIGVLHSSRWQRNRLALAINSCIIRVIRRAARSYVERLAVEKSSY